MHLVRVTAHWQSYKTFEFEDEGEAQRFYDAVSRGDSNGLDMIVANGDVDTTGAELTDWDAEEPREEA